MIAQEAVANDSEVVVFDGNKRVTFYCASPIAAQQLAQSINSDAQRCVVAALEDYRK